MGRPAETAELILRGLSPASIADRLKISFSSVMPYLYTAVGLGIIRRSDILFSIDKAVRHDIEAYISEVSNLSNINTMKHLQAKGHLLKRDDLNIYLELRNSGAWAVDMYKFLTEIELVLHRKIYEILSEEFGSQEEGWWRKGVPLNIRNECVKGREEDTEHPDEPYCYTTLVHLKVILDKNWSLFQRHLPKNMSSDKGALKRELDRINGLRNKIMHPVRSGPPSKEDFEFARETHKKIMHLK